MIHMYDIMQRMDHILLIFAAVFPDGTNIPIILPFETVEACFLKLKEVLEVTQIDGIPVSIQQAGCYSILNPA